MILFILISEESITNTRPASSENSFPTMEASTSNTSAASPNPKTYHPTPTPY